MLSFGRNNHGRLGRVVHGKWTGDPGVVVFPAAAGGGRWRVPRASPRVEGTLSPRPCPCRRKTKRRDSCGLEVRGRREDRSTARPCARNRSPGLKTFVTRTSRASSSSSSSSCERPLHLTHTRRARLDESPSARPRHVRTRARARSVRVIFLSRPHSLPSPAVRSPSASAAEHERRAVHGLTECEPSRVTTGERELPRAPSPVARSRGGDVTPPTAPSTLAAPAKSFVSRRCSQCVRRRRLRTW